MSTQPTQTNSQPGQQLGQQSTQQQQGQQGSAPQPTAPVQRLTDWASI